jgi:hypothetical protein
MKAKNKKEQDEPLDFTHRAPGFNDQYTPKAVKLISEDEREQTRQRAFGHMQKKEFKSEWYVHKTVAKYLRENYPAVRFYTTLDGFDLGNQRSLISALQWFEAGVPDLFIYMPSGKFTMLVLELKREGTNLKKKSGAWKDEHTERQASWLCYFNDKMKARAEFAIGTKQAIEIIENYLNSTQYGKGKRRS